MAKVSTKQFYFSRFGGYAGLQQVLSQDLVEIPDLGDGELTRPGTYLNVTVSEIIGHGKHNYTVIFSSGESYLHQEDCTYETGWYQQVIAAGGPGAVLHSLTLALRRNRHTAGYLNGEYYLIGPDKNIVAEFKSASSLQAYCRKEGISLRGVAIHDIQHTQARQTPQA